MTPLNNGQTWADLAAIEREHFGDPDLCTGVYSVTAPSRATQGGKMSEELPALPRYRWDQDLDALEGPYPDGQWVRWADALAAIQQERERAASIVDGECPAGWQLDLRKTLSAAIRKGETP